MAEGNYTYHGEDFIMHVIAESLCGTAEIHIILYQLYSSKKRKGKRKTQIKGSCKTVWGKKSSKMVLLIFPVE